MVYGCDTNQYSSAFASGDYYLLSAERRAIFLQAVANPLQALMVNGTLISKVENFDQLLTVVTMDSKLH